jgi:hypothetical protein
MPPKRHIPTAKAKATAAVRLERAAESAKSIVADFYEDVRVSNGYKRAPRRRAPRVIKIISEMYNEIEPSAGSAGKIAVRRKRCEL